MSLPNLKIKYYNIDTLKPYSRNARTHSDKQLDQIAASIKQFGFNNPILIDDNHVIIAGHGRLEAAKRLGMEEVPTVLLSHMTEAEKRAYILADNRLGELAGWDDDIIAVELQYLSDIPELNFDIESIGWETPEIDNFFSNAATDDQEDDAPDVDLTGPTVTKVGDVWRLGGHRLYCGNSLEISSYTTLMDKELAVLCFTDPPYNVPINGHVGNSGKTQHREFAMASGEMTSAEFIDFLTVVFKLMVQFSKDGSIHFQCMDWRHMLEMLVAAESAKYTLKNLCPWVKNNAGMGSLYRSQHELVFVFKNGDAPHINNVQLGKFGRYRTNVWEYPGVNAFGNGRMDELKMHPTVKPTAMVADAIKDCTRRDDIVLDPFGGSGTTLIAADKTGRRARLIELDPLYCDVTIRRWQALTGQDAVHIKTQKTFNETEKHGGTE